jgi:hypothetical protein
MKVLSKFIFKNYKSFLQTILKIYFELFINFHGHPIFDTTQKHRRYILVMVMIHGWFVFDYHKNLLITHEKNSDDFKKYFFRYFLLTMFDPDE